MKPNCKKIDLHTHTNYSDGKFSPTDLLFQAKNVGINVLSITDHDSIDGIEEAIDVGNKIEIEIIPGIELSGTIYDKEIHILSYFIDFNCSKLKIFLKNNLETRFERAIKIIEKLNEIKIPISIEMVLNESKGKNICRTHIANAMLKNGFIKNYHEAFLKYIGENKIACIIKETKPLKEIISFIKSIGGIVFLAHPGKNLADETISYCINSGIDGIEVYHPSHKLETNKHYQNIAKKHSLLECGGSDFHGKIPSEHFGKVLLPEEKFDAIKNHLNQTQKILN